MATLRDLDILDRLLGPETPPILFNRVPELPELAALKSPLHVAAARLVEAQELWEQNHYGPAVVLAQGVAESYFQAAVAALFAVRGDDLLGSVINEAVRGIGLGRKEHRAIYAALAGDELTATPFWGEYETGRRQRNEWVHGLRDISQASAERFLLAAVDLVSHVEAAIRRAGASTVRARYEIEDGGQDGLQITVTPVEAEAGQISIKITPVDRAAESETTRGSDECG